MNDMRTTRKEASAVGTENVTSKSGRLDERPRPNGPWSALRGVSGERGVFEKRCALQKRDALRTPSFLGWRGSAQISTDGISYAAGIGQAPG
jgi:hypothetical protein